MKTIFKIAILLALANIATAEKHGLVIAVGQYSTESLWPSISSINDIPHITSAIRILGFEEKNISIITNEQATKSGILQAISTLTNKVKEGDIVYIHYSGHGQQVVDDNGDELDGLDEAIVPYDSPQFFEPGVYEGENLIRDDLLGELSAVIRKKIGTEGQLILVLDSCHSGSGTRGLAKARGTDKIMGPSNFQPKSRGKESSMGLNINPENAAPMISFFGASSKELNYETLDDQSKPVGSLSYSLASILGTMKQNFSYGELFERIKLRMNTLAPHQNPQMEGPSDVLILGGISANRDLLYPIKEKISPTEIVADVGTMAEVHKGSIIEVFSMDRNESLVTGEVTQAYLTESDILLDEPLVLEENELVKLRVTERTSPPIKCAISNSIPETSPWNVIINQLEDTPTINWTHDNADLFIVEENDQLLLKDMQHKILLETPYQESRIERTGKKIKRAIMSFTQGKYLRSYDNESSFLNLKMQVVQVDCTDSGLVITKAPNPQEVNTGSCLKIIVKNEGKKAAYFSVLDIQPDNVINLVIPAISLGYTADEYYLEPGESYETNYSIEIAPPYGNEVMKVISTDKPLDLSGLMATRGNQTRGGATEHPFEKLMAATYDSPQTRGAKLKKPSIDQVGTHSIFFKIIE